MLRSRVPLGALTLLFCFALAPSTRVAASEFSARAQFFPGGQEYISTKASSKLAAANQALTECRTQHGQAAGYCDITVQSKHPVQTAKALKATIPDSPYPLYLWHIENQNSEVYLAGSIHLLKPGLFPLPVQYDHALANADYLVLEVDSKKLGATDLQQRTLKYGSLPRDKKLNTLLPSSTYQALSAYLTEYGAAITNFDGFKPNLVTQQLALLSLVSVGYNPELGLEAYFRNRAGNKPILELESFDFQLELLLNADLQTQLELTDEMLTQMPNFEPTTANLVSAWLRGDDAEFAAITAQQRGTSKRLRRYGRALIEDRNRSMADTITGYLNSEHAYFVLVGAAHLIGPEGIPQLLIQGGYSVKRISSNQAIAQN